MYKNLQNMYENIISQMIDAEVPNSTTKKYIAAFRKIILYNEKLNYESIISNELISSYLENNLSNYKNGKICKETFKTRRKAIDLLSKFSDTGKWKFERAFSKKIYNPQSEFFKQFIKEENLEYSNATHLSQSSIEINDTTLRKFCVFLEDSGETDFNNLTINQFKNFIISIQELNKGSLRTIINHLKFFQYYLKDKKFINFYIDLSFLKPQTYGNKHIVVFSKDEIVALITHIDLNSTVGLRDYAIILLGITTGLRRSDIQMLTLDDIKWKDQKIELVQKKTGKKNSIPLLPNASNALANYILNNRPSTTIRYVFLSSNKPTRQLDSNSFDTIIKRNCVKANIEKEQITFHSLRRTFCTWLSTEGTSLDLVAQCAGHSNINTVDKYISTSPEMINCCLDFEGIRPFTKEG